MSPLTVYRLCCLRGLEKERPKQNLPPYHQQKTMPVFAAVPTRCTKRKFEEIDQEAELQVPTLEVTESIAVPDVDEAALDSDADELTLEEYDAQFDLESDEDLDDLEYHYPHCSLDCEHVHAELEDLIANAESDVQLLIEYSQGRMSNDPAAVARLKTIFDRYKMEVEAATLEATPPA
eukprot:m.222550 g.222550  ORF g.222550 m.222550 type:complete len:178 (-) comp16054_c0_seq1:389-922(-)